ncbi:acetoin utilization protein AcuC [Naumannella halotolerans]|uniref:Acetoin utilization protein AcuC n=1 Tax=Naumannella halotolerans TaxID=993414 RepID=A0A4R7IYW7_9ACTN|nr:acetoin utilization protein AcuC [Naumannella halotolerans]TDT29982.1 acetoin utilization protein AcuC [Naumannella halotolerans]
MKTVLVHSPELERYSFGVDHPMGPGRVELTLALARQLGILDGVQVIEPPLGDQSLLASVHDEIYIAAVRADREASIFGIGTADNPLVQGMHDIASQICAATTEAARQVWTGRAQRAINVSGGLHHAMPTGTSGFCVYNDLGVAAQWLKANGAKRIAYVDVDAHHGDGVQKIFYNDPDVLTVSIHENPAYLFPGTGYPTEVGGVGALGSAVNVALPPGTGDAGWLRAFEAIVPPVLEAFQPDILITQHGCDSHADDPLTDLTLTLGGQVESYRRLGELADQYAHGRWVVTGGGGYAMPWVLPRAWAQLIGVVSGHPVDPETPMPSGWMPETWRSIAGPGPATVGEPEPEFTPITAGIDPADPVDQAILATRRAAFPELGLDPDTF